jgi:ParB family chromosome partitioning protein
MANTNTRRALGRGLSSLIPVTQTSPDGGQGVESVAVSDIRPNPFQPRLDFSHTEIQALADSIRIQGLLQPIIVRRKTDGFEIISGERRYRALKLCGQTSAPCIVRENVSDREMIEIALVENIQREDLNEIEKAKAYERLLLECRLSHEQLSERIGTHRTTITNSLRLLRLSAELQEMVRTGTLSMGHARALLSIDDPKRRQLLAQRIVEKKLSVREVEGMVQGPKPPKGKRTARPPAAYDPDTQKVIEKLQYKFGTSVAISPGKKSGGKLEISYYDTGDLNRILDILML